jgi:hypothetical protein
MEGESFSDGKYSHREYIEVNDYDICSPISGSMLPMIRVRRDSVLFVKPKGRLKRYDVALYESGNLTIMHRVLKVLPDGYLIRGDNSYDIEVVAIDQVFGVMKGFYRDERYISADNILYRIYARLWVALHPMLILYKKVKKKLV